MSIIEINVIDIDLHDLQTHEVIEKWVIIFDIYWLVEYLIDIRCERDLMSFSPYFMTIMIKMMMMISMSIYTRYLRVSHKSECQMIDKKG